MDEDAPAIVGDGDQSDWAAYDEMKAQLVARGIPENMIRYIHEANTDAQKAKLFDDARNGKIAVLIGSTEKMGTGTNVQARAIALHHMDVPWRPADLAQREGRVERQGNFNRGFNAEGVYDHDLFRSNDPNAPVGEVRVLRYVTEGTFDGYSWQTIERKAKFIAQMQKGNLDSREMEDIGDSALSAAEVKALAPATPTCSTRPRPTPTPSGWSGSSAPTAAPRPGSKARWSGSAARSRSTARTSTSGATCSPPGRTRAATCSR